MGWSPWRKGAYLCLIRELVVRPERVVMQYTDLHGKRKILKAQGYFLDAYSTRSTT
ncbi:putative peptide deformylase [Anaplasma phagocytophilum str. CRT53-1]|uniref:Putative peptide deformylase n=1 Tax=Anaplasma phagocytophilum str. CRT53-1 TaxID=1359157 RepID=A0A0F3PLR5_ANAPH|nr:putative peptide deformylase [Anaplasma phagocytophilum str. CRT53-1]